jgi:hypothetical protein
MMLFVKVSRAYISELILNTRRKILLIFSAYQTATFNIMPWKCVCNMQKYHATRHVFLCIRLYINKNTVRLNSLSTRDEFCLRELWTPKGNITVIFF